jgi:hypothetical protein
VDDVFGLGHELPFSNLDAIHNLGPSKWFYLTLFGGFHYVWYHQRLGRVTAMINWTSMEFSHSYCIHFLKESFVYMIILSSCTCFAFLIILLTIV